MGEAVGEKLIIHMDDGCAYNIMCTYITDLLVAQQRLGSRRIVVLCIGSERYIGDALGPLIGSYLQENINCTVYGTLDKPVHAGNLVEVIDSIHRQYYQPIIIAVDACLGKRHEIGNIEIWQGSLEAGIAVGAKLPSIGHISIIGVVNASSYIGYLDLQSTSLSIVMKLSKCIGRALGEAITALSIDHVV